MSATLAAVGSAIAIILPLLDSALKDSNYKEVKYYQSQLAAIQKKYNVSNVEFNNALSKYQQKYSDALNSYYSTTRNSIDREKLDRTIKDSKQGIQTTQDNIRDYTNKMETAQAAINEASRKYENKGLIETVSGIIGGKR